MTARVVPDLTENELNRLWTGIRIVGPDECWLWEWSTCQGYGQMELRRDNKREAWYTHILVYSSINVHIPGLDVMHSCDIRRCCNPGHLSQGTRQINMRDASARGKMGKGFDNEETISKIVELIDKGYTFEVAGRKLGISKSHTFRLYHGHAR